MPYSDFKALDQVVQSFNLTIVEVTTPLVAATSIEPSPLLLQILERELSWAR
jgi:hypothetical protein